MAETNNWTREETIIAFNVYCKIPFKKSSKTNPVIIKFAKLLGRSPSALNMKIGNLGRLDPELRKQGIKGLINGSKVEEDVWNEFNGDWDKLAFESERLISKFQNKKIQERFEVDLKNLPAGTDRESVVKTRVNQDFFRSTILSSYNSTCCVTGLSIPELLQAAHITSWKTNIKNRTNPHNGLCMNMLHHKAFDEGLIAITPEFKIISSKRLQEYTNNNGALNDFFIRYENRSITLPDRFLPSREFLDLHLHTIFQK